MKNRGVRGLRTVSEFRDIELIDFCVIDSDLESSDSRDEMILFVVSSSKGLLLATREALLQEARQIGIPFVDILNLNRALAQEVAIGGALSVSIMKIGKEDGQGVGYLEDGSMVAVNQSADMLGSSVLAKAKSVISRIGDGWFLASFCEKQLADHVLAIVTSDPFTRSLRLNSLLFLDLQLSYLNRLEKISEKCFSTHAPPVSFES